MTASLLFSFSVVATGNQGEARREPGHGWARVVNDTTAREAQRADGAPLSVRDAELTLSSDIRSAAFQEGLNASRGRREPRFTGR
jgi:hypothetical protein